MTPFVPKESNRGPDCQPERREQVRPTDWCLEQTGIPLQPEPPLRLQLQPRLQEASPARKSGVRGSGVVPLIQEGNAKVTRDGRESLLPSHVAKLDCLACVLQTD